MTPKYLTDFAVFDRKRVEMSYLLSRTCRACLYFVPCSFNRLWSGCSSLCTFAWQFMKTQSQKCIRQVSFCQPFSIASRTVDEAKGTGSTQNHMPTDLKVWFFYWSWDVCSVRVAAFLKYWIYSTTSTQKTLGTILSKKVWFVNVQLNAVLRYRIASLSFSLTW